MKNTWIWAITAAVPIDAQTIREVQSHRFLKKNSTHLLYSRINFNAFFLLFLFFTFAFQQPFWLSNCCSWKVGNVPGKEPARVSKSWAVPWSDSQVGVLTNQSLQSNYAQTLWIGPQILHPLQILASVVTQFSKMNLCKAIWLSK